MPTSFLPRDALYALYALRGIATVSRQSVRLLMYHGCSSKVITRVISLGSSLLGAPTSAIWSKWSTPKLGWNGGWISLKRGKIGLRLLLMTNRTSHTRFRLVPKSTTVMTAITSFKMHVFSEPTMNILMKIDLRCLMTIVFGNIRCMRIFAGIPWRGGVKPQTTVGLLKTPIFCTFAHYFFRSFRGKADIII